MAVPHIAVVVDSAAALPPGLQEAYGITVAPVRVGIGGQEFREGVNISPPRIVAALLAGDKVNATAPSAADFHEIYARLADNGAPAILSLHTSGKLSGAADCAREAASTTRVPVHVIDSGTVAMALGFTALAAGAIVRDGGSFDEAEAAARETLAGAKLFMTVDSMTYVHRAGNVPRVIKAVAEVTNSRPILSVIDGTVTMTSRVRGTEAARARVLAEATAYAATLRRPGVASAIVGGSVAEAGLAVQVPGAIVDGSPGAILAAQTGPGTYVVAVAPMPDAYAF